MQSSIITTLMAFAVALTVAAPAPAPEAAPVAEALERRANTNVKLCSDQNFGGSCTIMSVAIGGGCYNFPGAFNDVVSSLDTGGANTVCTFYIDGSCGGNAFGTRGSNPTVPLAFNDDLSSVRC